MSWLIALALIVSGVFVGFINTLAGGGTINSIALLMVLGLPANVANGTNRIAVVFQNITSVGSFAQQRVLDFRKGTWLAIPTIIGSIVGAQLAIDIQEEVFRKAMAIIMLVMLFFIIYKPSAWLKGQEKFVRRKVSIWQIIIFFLIGIYGGFIQVGVGYFLLAGIVLGAGYDLVKANAIKVWIVLLYTPFALIVFVLHGQVNWKYGLIHAIGNITGAWIASKWAVSWGANFVRWVIVVVIIVFSSDLLGIINIKEMIMN